MAIKLGGLAAKLKAGIDAAESARRAEEEAERRAAEEAAQAQAQAREARAEMMAELHGFAKEVEHFEVRKQKSTITVRFDSHKIQFRPEGDHDRIGVVCADDADHHLTRDELGEWEVVLAEEGGPRRLPLELGLEELITRYLAVPTAEVETQAPPPAPEPPAPKPAPAPPVSAAPEPEPAAATPRRRGPKSVPGSALRELSNPWD